MTKITPQSKCLILDANTIIEIHRIGIWEQLTHNCTLATTGHIQANQALYFYDKYRRIVIDLNPSINNKLLRIVDASSDDLILVTDTIDSFFLDRLEFGEIEILALIASGKIKNGIFCTGDGPAIEALAMLGKSSCGISLETILKYSGFVHSIKNLERHFCDEFFEKHLGTGSEYFITSTYIKKPII